MVGAVESVHTSSVLNAVLTPASRQAVAVSSVTRLIPAVVELAPE